MDRDTKILVAMLKDAAKEMLYANKWTKYGCASEEDAETYIEALLAAKSIRALSPSTVAAHVKGKPAIKFQEATCYAITSAGKDDLARLLAEM